MIFAHITAAGEAAGLTAERLNDLIERHEREEARTISLAKLPNGVWGNNEGGAAVVAQ